MSNWKLFGLTTANGITIIPCYYDIKRYQRNAKVFCKKHFNIVRFSVIALRFRALFDTTIKI